MNEIIKNKLNELLDLISISNADTLFYSDENIKIRLNKKNSNQSVKNNLIQEQEQIESNLVSEHRPDTKKIIRAERVGFIYLISPKTKKYYVVENQDIKEGDVLAIIVSMKIEYPVKSSFSGKIQKILIDNAQPVEYNQPLFEII